MLEKAATFEPVFGEPRRWTPDEDVFMCQLKAEGLGETRIGYRMGRSRNSVNHRWRLLAKRQAGGAA